MVTTRGGTETPGPTPTPRSSTRKTAGKRELESLETPTQTKRPRKTAPASAQKKKAAKSMQESDAPAEETSQDSVEVASDTTAVAPPSTTVPQTPNKKSSLPGRPRSSPKVVVGKMSPPASTAIDSVDSNALAYEIDFHTPMQAPGSVYATPATHMRPQGSPTPRAAKANQQTPAPAKKGKGRPKKSPIQEEPAQFPDEIPSSTQESDVTPIPSQDSIPTSAQPQKTHMRFGSEEPTEVQDSPVAPQSAQAEPVDDDDASDSDEAPEVVTTATATSKALAARAEADRAQKAQQAKEQAKRQAREELIAAQQAAKREREEKKAKKLAKKAAKEQKTAAAESDDEEEPEAESRMDVDVRNLPSLLPDSLLETIDDQRPPTPPPERRGKTEEELRKERLNHHIKFLERTDKPTKDRKKGKLSVAVLGQHNRVLPPKVSRNTKNVREHWLKGRKVEKKKGGKPNFGFANKVERRPHGSRGFLRNGDD